MVTTFILRHPSGAREMALPDALGWFWLVGGVEAQHEPGYLPPIGTFFVRATS